MKIRVINVVDLMKLQSASDTRDGHRPFPAFQSGQLEAMNISAADFAPDQSELPAAGLLATPLVREKPPRLLRAQASLKCRLFQSLPLGANTLFIGEVLMFHVARRSIAVPPTESSWRV